MRNEPRTSEAGPVDYVERVNRAIDFVVQGLDRSLKLEEVARVAGFSPFHFHRIFRSLVGETLAQFVKRLRLERALYFMSHDPRRSLTDVALDCGFASSSDFSRAFKQRYGVPPSAFDLEAHRTEKRRTLEREMSETSEYRIDALPPGANPDGFEVELVDLPRRTVAYIRVLEPFAELGRVVGAVERLMAWADARGFGDHRWLGYMWEDPEIVALEDCRYDVAVEIDASTRGLPDGEVGRLEFPAMRVAQVEVKGSIELEQRAIDYLFRTWLPGSGYVPAEQPCFEAWIGRPFAHGMEHFELNAQIPVVR